MNKEDFLEKLRRDSLHMSEYHIRKERCDYCKKTTGNTEICPKEDEDVCDFTPSGVSDI